MAREQRKDVDYFPHECTHGRKMYIIEEKFGNDGYATWFKLLEQLGKSNHHYIDISDDMTLMFLSSVFRVSQEKTMEILTYLSKVSAIDKFLFENHKVIYSQKFCDSIIDAYRRRKTEMRQYDDILNEIKAKNVQSDVSLANKHDFKPQCDGIKVTLIPKEEKNIEENIKEEKRKEKKTLSASPIREKIDFEQIVNIFNSVCVELPKATTIGDKRKKAIEAVLKVHSLEEIGDVFRNVSDSDFLSGRINNFTASFDWIFKPDNFIKILENNYKNNGNTNNNQPKSIDERWNSIDTKVDKYFN